MLLVVRRRSVLQWAINYVISAHQNNEILVVVFFFANRVSLFTECFVWCMMYVSSLSLGYYKLLRILSDSYQVLDDPGSN
jgi:hypothetical protein